MIKDIEFLKTKKDDLNKNVTSLKQQRNHFLSLYDSFIQLESILKVRCDIDLRTDLDPIVNLFYGFNEQGYDLGRIYEVYNRATGLDWEIYQKKTEIDSIEDQITKLQVETRGNEALLYNSRKNLDTFTQLEAMKFGLEELKQIWLTVMEIARSRKIDSDDAVSVFIKDVEENYHDKLLFQDRVVRRKEELETTNNQLIFNRLILSAQTFVATSMLQLYQNGITEQDVV